MRLLAVPSGTSSRRAEWAAGRPAPAGGDLVRGQPAPVGEHERLALRLGQAAQRVAHALAGVVALDRGGGLLLHARPRTPPDDLQPVPRAPGRLALAPQVERARARHEAEVGAELAAVGVERGRAAPDTQEDVLDDVLRLGGVAEDAHGGGMDAPLVLLEHLSEGLWIGEVHRHADILHVVEGCETSLLN